MSRNKSACKFKHTPISPIKNDIRTTVVLKHLRMDLITISQGIFDATLAHHNYTGWTGRILACDIDPKVRAAIEDAAVICPKLNILPPGPDIHTTVQWYLGKFGVSQLGAVDVDLAIHLRTNGKDKRHPGAWGIFEPVLEELVENRFSGKAFLTFVKTRDRYFKTDKARRAWIRRRLPANVELVRIVTYQSGRIDDYSRYSQGSTMGVAEFKFTKKRIRKAAA